MNIYIDSGAGILRIIEGNSEKDFYRVRSEAGCSGLDRFNFRDRSVVEDVVKFLGNYGFDFFGCEGEGKIEGIGLARSLKSFSKVDGYLHQYANRMISENRVNIGDFVRNRGGYPKCKNGKEIIGDREFRVNPMLHFEFSERPQFHYRGVELRFPRRFGRDSVIELTYLPWDFVESKIRGRLAGDDWAEVLKSGNDIY